MNETFDFLQNEEKQPEKITFRQKYINLLKKYRHTKHTITGLLVVVFMLGIVVGTMSVHYFNLITEAKEDVKTAVNLWQDDDIIKSKESVLKAKNSLVRLQKLLDHEILFKIPYFGQKLNSGEEIVDSSVSVLGSYASLIDLVKELKGYQNINYDQIADKKEALALIEELLKEVESVFNETEDIIQEVEVAGIGNWPIIKDALAEIKNFNDQDLRVATVFYPVLDKEDMTYLLLMQNNRKLMPTGGYIGNFGILKIKNGEIIKFELKDTPKFDRENKSDIKISTPEPLRKYYGKDQWELTDANWSPSFPLTAKRAQALYKAQGGEEEIDGVIAFSPEVVGDWLGLVGGVTVDNLDYDITNFANTPQYVKECKETEICERTELVGGRTIEGRDREYIINPIAQEVKNKLLNSPLKETVGVVNVLSKNVKEQNLFIYFNDPKLQEHVTNSGFSGDLLASDKDYLMVVDSNLSTARLDQYVTRNINYTVTEDSSSASPSLEATAEHSKATADEERKFEVKLVLTYNYDEKAKNEDPKIPAYRNYFRVYTPFGSELIGGQKGFDVDEDLGKTVFGQFISLNPGEEKVVELRYKLPANVIRDNEYKLVLQKQLGNVYTDFKINVVLDGRIKEYSPSVCELCPDGQTGQAVWQGSLDADKEFIIKK